MKEVLNIVCKKCKSEFRVKNPQKPGKYKIVCPCCKNESQLRIVDKETMEKIRASAQNDSLIQTVKQCPHCCFRLTAVPKSLTCPNCGKPLNEKSPEKIKTKLLKQAANGRAKLVVVHRFKNKEHLLREGVMIVGRKDIEKKSDVEIEGDATVSRQSVEISATKRDSGSFLYKMTIRNALNPVLVNGKRIHIGDSVYLNYGDIITLGKTKVRFEKA